MGVSIDALTQVGVDIIYVSLYVECFNYTPSHYHHHLLLVKGQIAPQKTLLALSILRAVNDVFLTAISHEVTP